MPMQDICTAYQNTKAFSQQRFIVAWLEEFSQPNRNIPQNLEQAGRDILSIFAENEIFNPFTLYACLFSIKLQVQVDPNGGNMLEYARIANKTMITILSRYYQIYARIMHPFPYEIAQNTPVQMLKELFFLVSTSCDLFDRGDNKFLYNIDLKISILKQIQKMLFECNHYFLQEVQHTNQNQLSLEFLQDRGITDSKRSVLLIWEILRILEQPQELERLRRELACLNPDGVTGRANWEINRDNADLILLHDISCRLQWFEFAKVPTRSEQANRSFQWWLQFLWPFEYSWSYFLLSLNIVATIILIFIFNR